MIGDTLGRLRYFQNLGRDYAEMVRGSVTASGVVTAAGAWLGLSKPAALALGVASMALWIVLAVAMGYAVWRYRVVHSTLGHEWRNDPFKVRQIELLEKIVAALADARPVKIVGIKR